MYCFAYCLITPKVSPQRIGCSWWSASSADILIWVSAWFQNYPQGQHGSSTDSAYFVLVDTYLKYFLPSEGSVPLSPFADSRGSVTAQSPRWLYILFIKLFVLNLLLRMSWCRLNVKLVWESPPLLLWIFQSFHCFLCWVWRPQFQSPETSHIPSAFS